MSSGKFKPRVKSLEALNQGEREKALATGEPDGVLDELIKREEEGRLNLSDEERRVRRKRA